MIHRRMKHLIIKTRALSERVIYAMLKINNRCSMQITHPTSALIDEESELFYENLKAAKNAEKTKFTIIIGDFNAKIGAKTDLSYVGTFSLDERNRRGQTMINFLNKEKIYCLNTFEKHLRKKDLKQPR